ncbi:STAS domain-containing protein [Streptomyces sp. NPDC101151]|uniref:STAS domain-containing protein n=1 Tax=Streptomyces sp. NPDC101151 TaxID=3366115 RepID=UPI00382090CE
MPDLIVQVRELPDRILLTLVGELDLDTFPRVVHVTDQVSLRGRILCLDLSGMPFMDASGLELLQRLQERADAEGGLLELCDMQAEPQRVLDLTGTRTRFRIVARTNRLWGGRPPADPDARTAARLAAGL